MQRRAAMALLAFIAVGGALVVGVYAVGGRQDTRRHRVAVGRRARVPGRPRRPSPRSSGPGVDLITDDPRRALELLNAAYAEARRGRGGGLPARADRRRCARRRSRASTGCTASCRVASRRCSPSRPRSRRSSRRSCAAPTAPRTSSTRRTRPCGGSTSRRRRRRRSSRAGQQGVGHEGVGAEAAHDRRPRHPDPRRQEHAVALAARRTARARARSSGSGSRTRPPGATTSRTSRRSSPTSTPRSTSCTSSTRPSRTSWSYVAGQRRLRLPASARPRGCPPSATSSTDRPTC